jgi:transposase
VPALTACFEQRLARISSKAKIAEHLRYALNRWDGLTRFLDDRRIELDTNIVERSIRPLVLNRKNSLFAGTIMAPRIGPASPLSSKPAS